ncbi:hypothetical protein B9Z65_8148 [Elsinoe australis]|uniref:Stc1 domain-containing protein n=1 Tax=Elsinoe australis TaxID=40998 RepID=A0A2P7YW62_9PEZI|nr:hypothetical protein B9Z65_8148 [Elsinoe australis]
MAPTTRTIPKPADKAANKWQNFNLFESDSVTSSASAVAAPARSVTSTGQSGVINYDSFVQNPNRGYKRTQQAQFFIPDELKCTLCNVPKNLRGFSLKQQDLYKSTRGAHQIICMTCNGTHKQELTCYICDKTMPLKKFAKSQRRADDKECLDCVAKRIGADDGGAEDLASHTAALRITDGKGAGEEKDGDRGRAVTKWRRWEDPQERVSHAAEWEDGNGLDDDVDVESDDSGDSVFSV